MADHVSDPIKLRVKIARNYLVYFLFYLFFTSLCGVGIAYFSKIPDWFMFLLMYMVQVISVLLYIKAYYRERTILRFFFALFSSGLFGFWIWILYDRIQPRWIFYNDQLIIRDAIPILVVPIALSALAIVIIWIHAIYLGRTPAKKEPEKQPSGGLTPRAESTG